MKTRLSQSVFLCVLVILIVTPSAYAQELSYSEVAPIFRDRCVLCHAGAAAPMELRLDSFDAVMDGSANGPVVKAGNPADSELLRRIKGSSQPRMPMTGPPFLSEQEISLIESWIAAGLPPGASAPAAPVATRTAVRPEPGQPVTYAHVAPIFATRCAKCHTQKGLMGPAPEGYLLTSYDATLAAGDRIRVAPGAAEASELVRRVRGQARPRMPFDGPPFLSEEETVLIVDWIKQGARDANGTPAPERAGARVRLHGTLREEWKLDALELIVTPSTRVDKSPIAGDYVQVRGRLRDDGAVIADRIRPR